MSDIYDTYDTYETYGELDVLFNTTSRLTNPSKSKKRKGRHRNTLQKNIENARIRAKHFRAQRKADFLSSVKYSESLLKQNAKLKEQICLLKKQLKILIMICKH